MRKLITSQQRRRMDFISLTLVAHVHSALVAFVTYDVTRDTFMQGSAVNIINKQAHERVRQQTLRHTLMFIEDVQTERIEKQRTRSTLLLLPL